MVSRGGVNVQLKRKSQAPFYKALHRWLLRARHKHACEEHESALLEVQQEFLQGRLSTDQIQRRVHEIVAESTKVDESASAREVRPCVWYHTISADGVWEAVSGWENYGAEILLRRQFSKSGALSPTYQLKLSLKEGRSAADFHFALLHRMAKESNGLTNEDPLRDSDSLTSVHIDYAPNEPSVAKRWDQITNVFLVEQRVAHEKLIAALVKLQRASRGLPLHDPIKPPARKKGGKKRRAKRNKAKNKTNAAPLSTAETENSQIVKPEEREAVHSMSGTRDNESAKAGLSPKEALTPSQEFPVSAMQEPSLEQKDKDAGAVEAQPVIEKDCEAQVEEEPQFQDDGSGESVYSARLDILSGEVSSLAENITKMMTKMKDHRQQLLWRLQDALSSVFPCAKVNVFGSHATGFALPSSDVDVYYTHRDGNCLGGTAQHHDYMPSPECQILKLPVVEQLQCLFDALQELDWVKHVKLIKTAVMPVIRVSTCLMVFQDDAEDTHLKSADHFCPMCCMVDLSCGHAPGHSNMLLSNMLKDECVRFPALQPLVLVLKQILVERKLSNVFSGGLSSFSLSLMVLRYLQHCKQSPKNEVLQSVWNKHPSAVRQNGARAFSEGHTTPEQQKFLQQAYYSRSLAKWPVFADRNTPRSYERGVGGPPPRYDAGAPYALGMGPPRNPTQEAQAYHRQLADWPSTDAAHHMSWMRVKESGRDLHSQSSTAKTESKSLDLGSLLLGFVDFYGNEFQPSETGLTVIGGGAFYRLATNSISSAPQPITIDNPCWPNLNVAAPSYAISSVLAAFREIHRDLLQALHNPKLESSAQTVILRRVVKTKWGAKSRAILENALTFN